MENNQDFVMEHGVLKKYHGAGGRVTIPEGVTKIGEGAFRGCISLTNITVPGSVTEIGEGAFQNCLRLSGIAIPEKVTKIGENAFSYCANLTGVTIPEGITEISDGVFRGCGSLTSIALPEGVKRIGKRAFSDCTSLTSILLSDNITEIGEFAFHACVKLTEIEVNTKNLDDCLEAVTGIGEDAFQGCIRFIRAAIPRGIRKVPKTIFAGCRPVLIAPHIPIADFDAKDKSGACCGFAIAYLAGRPVKEEIRAGYLNYIKRQKKRLYPIAVQHEQLLRLMLAEKMPARQDIDLLLAECDQRGNLAAKAAVMEYAGKNLKPVDPVREFKL